MSVNGSGITRFKGAQPTAVNSGEVLIGGGRIMIGGTLSAKEVKVTSDGADYVFEDDYHLRELSKVEAFVKANRHLPDISPAVVMQREGMGLSEIVTVQLAKIEELTLYAIQAEKERDTATAEVKSLKRRVLALEAAIQKIAGAGN